MKRLRDLFAPYSLEDVGVDLQSAFAVSRKLRKHDAMRVLKTWVNSWATSHRMHDPIRLPCLLGCQDGADSMAHYVQCPFLYYLLVKLRPDSLPSPFPVTRIGAAEPTIDSLKVVSCSFAAYHAVRRSATHNSVSLFP